MTNWYQFLQQQGAQLQQENGVTTVTSFGEHSSQYPDLINQNLLFELGQLVTLNFIGEGARKLLQGQTTCDFNSLSETEGLLGAQCTPKGRMIATFYALQRSSEITLITPKSQAEAISQSLAKYAPFFRVTIEEDSSNQLIGLSGPDADSICTSLLGAVPDELHGVYQSEQGLALKLSEQRLILLVPEQKSESAWQLLSKQAKAVGSPLWSLQEIRDGFSHVTSANREQLVPQMLNLQAIGGINFKKGCYTGQEVVARLHYLGKSKRHMYRLAINSANTIEEIPTPGTHCHLPDSEQPIGEVVNAALADQTTIEILAVFKESAVNAAQLQIGSLPTTDVEWLPLPYSLK